MPLRVFISYAHEQYGIAEPLAHALRNIDHDVFLDEDDLPPGDEFHLRIKSAIDSSDLFIFLVSPESVAGQRYTLSELKFARQKWPKAKGHVLSVMAAETPKATIPTYLYALGVLHPKGNLEAETLAAVHRIAHGRVPNRLAAALIAISGLVALAGAWIWAYPRFETILAAVCAGGAAIVMSSVLAVASRILPTYDAKRVALGAGLAVAVAASGWAYVSRPEVLWLLPGTQLQGLIPDGATSPFKLVLEANGTEIEINFPVGGIVVGPGEPVIQLALRRFRDQRHSEMMSYLRDRGVQEQFHQEIAQRWTSGASETAVIPIEQFAGGERHVKRTNGGDKLTIEMSTPSPTPLSLAFIEPEST